MNTKPAIDLVADDLNQHGSSSAADIANRLGLTIKQVQRAISNHNRAYAPTRHIVQVVAGQRGIPGAYILNINTDRVGEVVSTDTTSANAMEQATSQLAQCIAGQLRSEFDLYLAEALRPA